MATIVALLLAALAGTLAGGGSPGEAGGIRIVSGTAPSRHAGAPPRARPHPGRVIVVPQPVYLAPRPCWTPGAWTYQWIPQSGIYYEWVPGHYNTDALWVEGHYAPRALQAGYWQPIWIEGRWVAC